MTENLQRESMRLRDVVYSVQALPQLGRTPGAMARQLGMSQSRPHLYQQLGDILQAQPKRWPYFDTGLISIEQFRTASPVRTSYPVIRSWKKGPEYDIFPKRGLAIQGAAGGPSDRSANGITIRRATEALKVPS